MAPNVGLEVQAEGPGSLGAEGRSEERRIEERRSEEGKLEEI